MNGNSRIAAEIEAARKSGDLQPLVEAVPYFRWMGLRIDRHGEELLTVMPYQEMLIGNPMLPALHGGTIGAFLESAAMVSLIGAMATPKLPKIINITIEYLRPGRPMDSYATGIVTKQGRRVANVRAYAWQQDRDKLIATASTHFLIT